MRLKDKVVLITASTRGIGLATVQACAKEGAIVYMVARNLEIAAERAKELNDQGFNVKTVYKVLHLDHLKMFHKKLHNPP